MYVFDDKDFLNVQTKQENILQKGPLQTRF